MKNNDVLHSVHREAAQDHRRPDGPTNFAIFGEVQGVLAEAILVTAMHSTIQPHLHAFVAVCCIGVSKIIVRVGLNESKDIPKSMQRHPDQFSADSAQQQMNVARLTSTLT